VKRSPLLPIFLIVLVDILGLTIILPLLPFYAEKLGATAQQATLLVSVYAVCQLVAGPLLGRMSDRTGRKPLLLVSQVGTFIGFLILANAWALWVVFVSRIIDGLTAGNLSLAQAYIADVTAPKDRARSFGVIGIAFGIGFLVGPGLSGFLSGFGYHWPIYAAAALSLTSIVCTATLLPANPPLPEGVSRATGATKGAEDAPAGPGGERLSILAWGQYARYFRRPGLASLLLQFFAFTIAFASFTSGFALFAERRLTWHGHPFGPKEVGYVFAYSGFLGIILQGGLIGRLVKRFGEAALVRAGFLAAAVGYALLGAAHGVPVLLAAATISAFGNGVLRPALTSLITQRVSRGEQGTVLGLNQSLLSIGQIAGPALAGALIGNGFLASWAFLAALVVLVGLLLSRKDAELGRTSPSPGGGTAPSAGSGDELLADS
jgi:MFS transporter, DHA1 family, tetracycline resistance protein